MRTPAPSPSSLAPSGQPEQVSRRWRGGWFVLVQIVWVGVVGLACVLFIVSIPTYVAFLHTFPTGMVVDLNGGQLTQQGVHDLHALGLSINFYVVYRLALNALFLLGFITIGGLLFWHQVEKRMAVLASFVLVGAPFGILFQLTTLPPAWSLLVRGLDFGSGIGLGLFFYLFPSGTFVPHWTRWLLLGWAIHDGITDFLPFPSFYFLSNGLFFALLVSLVLVQIHRYRSVSTHLQRQQTRWVVFGCTVAMIGFLGIIIPGTFSPSSFQPGTLAYFIGETALTLFLLCIPLSIGIAILRSRLWDIDLIINRTLVYGVLTASVAGLYILVVGYIGALFRTGGNLLIELVATGLVAVLFQPLRGWLQRSVNRLMYGKRDEPYAVMTRLSTRLEGTLASEAVLPTIVETTAQALKLPYAAITLWQGGEPVIVASCGVAQEDLLRLPLSYQGELIGELLLTPRAPGEAFSSADRRLLDELARHAGLAAHAVRLTTDLQRSREHLVTTREEERRRLRRDLHDGLGSALTSVMFKLDASDTLFERDPGTARTLLAEGRAQMQAAIADIRRLVYDLRPPILDEWGLLAALREQIARFEYQALQVTLEAPEPFPPLSAAAEVAVYRIVLEALANVVKHAQATTCTIRLAPRERELHLEVEDDGQGRPTGSHAGVGTSAMRERAAELGGTLTVMDTLPHGARVYARLPLAKERAHDE